MSAASAPASVMGDNVPLLIVMPMRMAGRTGGAAHASRGPMHDTNMTAVSVRSCRQ